MGGRICARALLEGCAFAMRDVADRLRGMGAEMRSLLLLGGGAAAVCGRRCGRISWGCR